MPPRLSQQLRLGLPMGLLAAADLIGIAIFQIMQVRLGDRRRRGDADGR